MGRIIKLKTLTKTIAIRIRDLAKMKIQKDQKLILTIRR